MMDNIKNRDTKVGIVKGNNQLYYCFSWFETRLRIKKQISEEV